MAFPEIGRQLQRSCFSLTCHSALLPGYERNCSWEQFRLLPRFARLVFSRELWLFTQLPVDGQHVWAQGRWHYLAAVIDLFARRVVGWAFSSKPDANLVIKTLGIAYQQRGWPQNVLFHLDQGSQYASRSIRQRLWRYRFKQSMSLRRKCHDNAPMERLFRSLKTDWYRPWAT